MPDPLLNLFKYLLIALIWLFFLRVLRAVWVESKSTGGSVAVSLPAPASPPVTGQVGASGHSSRKNRPRGGKGPKLIAVSGTSVTAGNEFAIGESVTIGRGQGCGIAVVKDTFASSVHARVYPNGNGLYVEDLDSTNGTFVNGEKVLGSRAIVSGDRLQVGQTIFEVSL